MVQNNKYWYLRNHKLFDQLNSEEIEELCIISNMKNAEKNDVIFFNDSEIKKNLYSKSWDSKNMQGA